MYNSTTVCTELTQFRINTSIFRAFFLRDRCFCSHGIIACRSFCFRTSVQLIATVKVPIDLYVIIFALSRPEYSVHFYAVDLFAAMVLPVESYLVIFPAIMSHIPLCCTRLILLCHQPFLCNLLFLFGFCAPTTSCHHGW
jgi:hypothetical protein